MKSTFRITNPVIIMVSRIYSNPDLSVTEACKRPAFYRLAPDVTASYGSGNRCTFGYSCKSGTSRDPEALLFDSQDRVLGRLSDSKFDDGFGWNFDLLLRLGIEAHASLPFLLNELAEAWQNEFAVFFDRFVGEGTQCIEEYTGGSFVGLSGFSERDLKFGLGHV